jgi:hypothetical protein
MAKNAFNARQRGFSGRNDVLIVPSLRLCGQKYQNPWTKRLKSMDKKVKIHGQKY